MANGHAGIAKGFIAKLDRVPPILLITVRYSYIPEKMGSTVILRGYMYDPLYSVFEIDKCILDLSIDGDPLNIDDLRNECERVLDSYIRKCEMTNRLNIVLHPIDTDSYVSKTIEILNDLCVSLDKPSLLTTDHIDGTFDMSEGIHQLMIEVIQSIYDN